MRILVLGLDSPLGYSLRSFAAPLMRHEIVGVDMDATRWRRERQVKKLIRRQPIDLILDARARHPDRWRRSGGSAGH